MNQFSRNAAASNNDLELSLETGLSSPSRWVLIKRHAEITGYSEDAIRHKIKNGVWLENRIWRKAPDGRIFISVEEFERWVESDAPVTAFR